MLKSAFIPYCAFLDITFVKIVNTVIGAASLYVAARYCLLWLACCSMIRGMLVREPSHRASLADIMEHPWMKEEVRSVSKQALTPLVCRETLTDDDHWHIVQRIVDGKIASKEDVIQYVAAVITLVKLSDN